MAIAASGAVSFSDLRTEFVGGSSAISYSDLYRGGSNIRAKAANNNGTNLAASVPTSGTINFTNFRSQAKGFKYTYAATSTDQDADALFGSDYAVNYPKIIEIPSGVTIGGVSDDALDIPAGLAGSLVINNSGSIIGKGGAANGGAGGNAISCAASGVVFNNLAGGILAGGGGGGGAGGSGGTGGTGGGGQYSSTVNEGPTYATYPNTTRWELQSSIVIWWGGSNKGTIYNQSNSTTQTISGVTYTRGTFVSSENDGERSFWRISRSYSQTTNTNGGSGGSGGSGGAGGQGQGYNQGNAAGVSGGGGSSGAAGGTNAGSGGTGGTGGTGGNGGAYGASGNTGGNGATGNTGANGNRTNGSAGSGGASGSSGGAAGAAIAGTSITINNSGNVYGATA